MFKKNVDKIVSENRVLLPTLEFRLAHGLPNLLTS